MTVYVAEILGRRIAAFDAADDTEAAELRLTDRAFRRDLVVLQNSGRPLWDGVSPIHVRTASAEEARRWQDGVSARRQNRFVFLVPVVDPLRFDDDGHDDDDHDGN